jgi:hypothetical protein
MQFIGERQIKDEQACLNRKIQNLFDKLFRLAKEYHDHLPSLTVTWLICPFPCPGKQSGFYGQPKAQNHCHLQDPTSVAAPHEAQEIWSKQMEIAARMTPIVLAKFNFSCSRKTAANAVKTNPPALVIGKTTTLL